MEVLLKKILAVLDEHTKILNEHTNILNKHTKILDQHTQKFDEHTKILDQHTQKFDEHTKILDQHTQKFDEHTKILDQHTQKFDEHSANFASLDNRMEQFENNMNERFDNLATELRSHLKHFDKRLDHQQKMFEIVSTELKSVKVDIEYVSGKIGQHDTEINNLSKRIRT